jgi:L-fucose isomerase-like protein
MYEYEIRKPKIGIAGVMCTPFRGDKEGNYSSDYGIMEKFAEELSFELFVVEQGIYDLSQAEKAAGMLAEWNPDYVLLQTSSFASGDFLYPFTRLNKRMGLWFVPEGWPTSEGGLPLNSFTAANMYNSIIHHRLKDFPYPVKWFGGHAYSNEFIERLIPTVNALRALVNLPGTRVGLIGGVAPSFDNLIGNPEIFREKFGVEIVEFEIEEVLARADRVDEDLVKATGNQIRESAAFFDERQTGALTKTAKLYQSILSLTAEKGISGVALSCWPQFQEDYGLAVCSLVGHLNTTTPVTACEGDVTSAVSMLMLHYMTFGGVVTLMDLVSIDDEDQSVLLWHCGPTSPVLADENGVRMQPLWLFDGPDAQQTGLHNDMVLRPGKGTVMGLTPDLKQMLVLEGEIDNLKESYTGSRGWFKDLKLNKREISTPELVQTLMESGFQHHYPFSYGWMGSGALELCAYLDIEPIQKQPYTNYLRGYYAG